MSGCRRTTPDAVHGTSARMRSNGRPSHQLAGLAASPSRTSISALPCGNRARFSRTRASRARSTSSATISYIGKLCQMRRLAARRGARVEHAHAFLRTKQGGRELRAGVLHRERAFRVPRKLGHRAWRQHDDSGVADGSRADACVGEAREQCVTRADAHVGAQRKRRSFVAGFEDRLPVGGKVGGDPVDPPARIRPPCDRVRAHRASNSVSRSRK